MQIDPQYKFYPLEDSDLNEERYLIVEGKDFSSEDGYTISKMEFEYKYSCLLVRSMLLVFQSFTHMLRTNPTEEIRNETYNRIQKTLKNLINFVFAKESDEDIDYFKISDDPIQEKQQILKDLGIIDLLVEFLYQPFRTNAYQIKNLKMSSYIAKILEMTYSSIRYVIAEYRPNELYASQ